MRRDKMDVGVEFGARGVVEVVLLAEGCGVRNVL